MDRSAKRIWSGPSPGERAALDADYRTHASWLRAMARRQIDRPDEAEDLVQEAYVRASRYPAAERSAAVLQQMVTTHLIEALVPMVAMGPAWTIVRAIAAEPEPGDMTQALEGVAPGKAEAIQRIVRDERARDHRAICDGLTRFGDDEEFRYRIRTVLLDTVTRYDQSKQGSASAAQQDC